jgi:anti-sigma factor RsiW
VVDHISDLQWDRLLANELSAEASEAVRAHAGRCAACSARLRELTAERAAFETRPLPTHDHDVRDRGGFGPAPRAHTLRSQRRRSG